MRISDWSSDVCSSDLLGVLSTPTPKLAEAGQDVLDDTIWTRQCRRQFGVELKIVDEKGQELPSDGESAGSVLVRGPWVIERYYLSDASALDADGWFDTGDIATIDEYGFMRITDRQNNGRATCRERVCQYV